MGAFFFLTLCSFYSKLFVYIIDELFRSAPVSSDGAYHAEKADP